MPTQEVKINVTTSGAAEAERKFSGIGKTIQGIAWTAAGIAAARFAGEVVNISAKAEGVERAFKRIGGIKELANLRAATKGTVSDLELMTQAVRASNFEIPLEQLATLLKFAQVRALETGQSVDYLVDSIVMGIGRKSTMVLDNLGITASKLKEHLHGASLESKSVGEVSEIVGKIAAEALSKAGDQALTTSERIGQMGANWENLKKKIGDGIISITLKAGVDKALPMASNLISALDAPTGEELRAEADARIQAKHEKRSQELLNNVKAIQSEIKSLQAIKEQLESGASDAFIEKLEKENTQYIKLVADMDMYKGRLQEIAAQEEKTRKDAVSKEYWDAYALYVANIDAEVAAKQRLAEFEAILAERRGAAIVPLIIEIDEIERMTASVNQFGEAIALLPVPEVNLDVTNQAIDEIEAKFYNLSMIAQQVLGGALQQAFRKGTFSARQFGNIIGDMLARLAAQAVVFLILNAVTGGGFGKFVSMGKFLGFKAEGGPIEPGRPYIVGERGPELIVPKQSGFVLPQVPSGTNLTVNINSPITDRQFVRNYLIPEIQLAVKNNMA
jgi:hypothetical protein